MKRFAPIAALALTLGSLIGTTAHAATKWTLTADSVNITLNGATLQGVSPYVEKLPSGDDRIYLSGPLAVPDNILVADCTNTGSCTRQTIGSKFGNDVTIVTLKDKTRRVFFVDSSSQSRTIKYATLNSDGLSHGTPTELGVEGSSVSDKRGWGVPDTIVKPDGNVKVFWVTMDYPPTNNPPEDIISATSTDASATKFTRDGGFRLRKGFVDTKILKATPGDWVMICSTGPTPGQPQKLYIATSQDGNSWNVNPNPITSDAESALDPTGYQIDDNTWRIYYVSTAPGEGTGTSPKIIKRATLKKSDDGSSSNQSNQNNQQNNQGGQSGNSQSGNPINNPLDSKVYSMNSTWILKPDDVNLNLFGVSPHVEKLPTGEDRLYLVSPQAVPDNLMITDCNDSGSCTRRKLGSNWGSDVTVVTLKDGARRTFFVDMNGSNRSIKYATLNSDGLSFGSTSDLGVQDASISDKRGWGVPDSVVLPDGRVRVYWVNMDYPPNRMPPEDVISATSTDASATSFTRDSGYRFRDGYASTKILRAKTGDWLMILCTASTHARLFIATSSDGLTWNVDPNPISDANESAFDPTGYQLSDNSWRIYYASSPVGQTPDGGSIKIKRATLTKVVSTPSPTPSPSSSSKTTTTTAKSTTITCVKGKITTKVTGVNPKCPTGYTKK